MRSYYKTYPKSRKLTDRSRLVHMMTQPHIALAIGGLPGIILMAVLMEFTEIPMPILGAIVVAGMVAGLVLAPRIRKKKIAKYDAEYAELLKNQQ